MEFPNVEDFPRTDVEEASKWRDLPTTMCFVVSDFRHIKTRYGMAVIANLQSRDKKDYKVWVPNSVSKKFDEFQTPFFILNYGLQESKYDKKKSYFDVSILPGN